MASSLKNHFIPAFFTVLLAVGAFYLFKALLPDRLFAEAAVQSDKVVVDSMMLLAVAESQAEAVVLTVEEAPDTVQAVEEVRPPGLGRFFEKLFALEKTKTGAVRIAYFGDSMIEGDLIVQDIRRNYQRKYGGQGVGFVPLSSMSPHLGISVKYEYSPGWATYSFLKKAPVPVGVNGYVSIARDSSSWTRYRAGSSPLMRPTLFYGWSGNGDASVRVTINDEPSASIKLQPNRVLNKISLAQSAGSLTLQFVNADSIPFYGVNFAGRGGVNIDNFASRGNSGLPLSTFSERLMNAFHQELRYDLIVLQYGTNVLNSKSMAYEWYAVRMTNVVNHLKKCFPGADILVVSVADRATKYETEMKTDSATFPLIRAQKKYAGNTGSMFVNLFKLMGGEGTMVKWVNADPPMAVTDYTHFNSKGSKRIADLIFGELEREYENFKIQNNLSVDDGEGGGPDE
jgi:lysophospholipase L1-like esterase